MKDFAEIAVELPVEGTFTYGIPMELKPLAHLGKRALVPFGKRTVTGYITGLSSSAPEVKGIRPIIDLLDEEPVFDEKRLKFFKWLSSYYFAPLGTVLALINPGGTNIRSHRRFHLARPLEGLSAGKSGLPKEILDAARDGVNLSTLLKRFKGKPVYSMIARLKKEGLLEEEVILKGGVVLKTEDFIAVSYDRPQDADLKRSPIQAKVHKYLLERGETSIAALKKELGNIDQAVKKLEEKGLVKATQRQVLRDPLSDIAPKASNFEPNAEQKAAIDEILDAIKKDAFSPFLLYGVTGSGKTLVYLRVLEEVIRRGKKAIFLSPEIALTPWPAAYLAEKFPGRVALAHSGLSPGERMDEWRRILMGEADIVVGARSALFSPVKELGLIIVDEEHETSYKDEGGIRYNARDAALMLGKYLGITVVLGSATPSVESFHNAKNGKLKLLAMKKRVEDRRLPEIEVMDMKGTRGAILSGRLKELLSETFEDKGQALLFLNRRGFSNSIICKDCGYSFSCLNCSVTLTMHKGRRELKCHYCDLSIPLPEECPKCRGVGLINPGAGTERVEEEVRALFPEARVGRMDRDTTQRKGAAKRIIESVEEKMVDILIGTQMVSKGHHFPGISLVGVISGDTSLNIPEFRSSERTFQLITQAAGRAGRGDVPGRVVIQTLNPEHYCFRSAITHDYDGFFEEEIKIREEALYPPFVRLCNLRVESQKEERAVSAITALRAAADRLLKNNPGIVILGPTPALLTKLKGRYRWQILIKGIDVKGLNAFIKGLKNAFAAKKESAASLIIDMDPINIA